MIIKTKIENSKGGMRTAYYKYMGTNGKPTLGGKNDAAQFPPEQAQVVLKHLQTIDARFVNAEVTNG